MTNFKRKIGFIIASLLLFSLSLQAQDSINIMTFNVWQEGTSVPNGLEKIRDIIVEANADIICFAEVRNYSNQDWTTKIVNELSSVGQAYHDSYIGGDVSIISKFPITNSSLIYNGQGSIALFDIQLSEKMISVACAHLDYTHYACYLPRGYNGGSPNWNLINDGTGNPDPILDIDHILAYNLVSTRDEQIATFLDSVKNITNPVIFLGDFNEPSHKDWKENTSQLFDHNGLIIPWQNTLVLEDNGYVDAYREFFPDAAINPGITWPSFADEVGTTSWTPLSDERDRIDFIFYKGEGIRTSYAALVGPKESYAYNQTSTSNTSNENFLAHSLPWPSDHKAVFTTLNFAPIVSVNENSFKEASIIYPNPSKDFITIKLKENFESIEIDIFDIQGKRMSHEKISHQDSKLLINIGHLEDGIYIISYRTDKVRQMHKLIVEN